MRRISYGVLIVFLMVGTAAGQSQSDLVGTWSSIITRQGAAMIAVLTISEDFTYKMEVRISGILFPIEQGTYVLSGDKIVITPVSSTEEERVGQEEEIAILSFSKDQLVLFMQDQVATWTRGILKNTQMGQGSISGTIRCSDPVESYPYILILAFPPGDKQIEDLLENPSSLFMTSIPTMGPYTISGLPDGIYYVVACMDFEGDFEPHRVGVHGTLLVPQPVEIVNGAAVTGIDVELRDRAVWIPSAVTPQSWAQVKAAFK